ncbi:MAG: ATP-binding protein [Chloroflexota bacterium]
MKKGGQRVEQERILVIDDSPEAQQRLSHEVLQVNGYRHLEALTAEEGLAAARDRDPALIILDQQLPDGDGFALLEELRELCGHVPVIFATADDSTASILRAFRLGASDVISRPFQPEETLAAIRRTLASGRPPLRPTDGAEALRESNRRLQRRLQELNTVYAIGRAVTSLLDLNRVLNRVVEAAVYTVGADEGTLMLLDRDTNELTLRAAKGVGEKTARNLRLRVDDSAAGQSLRSNRPVHLTGDRLKVATGYLVKALLYVPLSVAGGGPIGVLGVTNRASDAAFSRRDIDLLRALADYATVAIENARLYQAVETERTRLETILREAREVIVVTDEENRVLLCNAAARALWDLTDDDLTHRPVEEILPDPAIRDIFVDASQTNEPIRRELTLGDARTFNAQLTPVEAIGRVLMMQDITHLKKLDRLKSEFVTTVSHDLRTPLTAIQGYVELLPKVGPLNERQAEFVGRIERSINSVTALINDLLDIRRIEAELDVEMAACDVPDLIAEAVASLRPYAEEKGQTLRWERPEALPPVRGNRRRLRQAVTNLVDNAIKYTPEGGRIAVEAAEDDEHVVVRVSDTGIGIPPDEQPRVFDRFYRVESEETADIMGTGLGLAIVKAVVEKHDGRVWVESRPGVGSVFTFVLPALEEKR